jgi:hypothetical protein
MSDEVAQNRIEGTSKAQEVKADVERQEKVDGPRLRVGWMKLNNHRKRNCRKGSRLQKQRNNQETLGHRRLTEAGCRIKLQW